MYYIYNDSKIDTSNIKCYRDAISVLQAQENFYSIVKF